MSWQKELKKQARDLEEYTSEVESKLRFAEKRLAEVAQGAWYPSEAQDAWSKEDKMKATAAFGLAGLSKMPCRKRPPTYMF